jgi:hypothetical protein
MMSAMHGVRVMVAAAGLVQFGCEPTPKPGPVGLGEGLRELSVPPDGTILSAEAPASAAWSLKMHWTLKAGMSWAQYQAWIAGRLRPEFDEVKHSANRIWFCKLLPGDSVLLDLELTSGGDPITLRASYAMAPD